MNKRQRKKVQKRLKREKDLKWHATMLALKEYNQMLMKYRGYGFGSKEHFNDVYGPHLELYRKHNKEHGVVAKYITKGVIQDGSN